MFNVNIQMEKYKYENQNQRQSGVAHSSASAARPEIITARNSKAGAVSGFCFDASVPVRTPRNGLGLLDPLGLRGETWRTSTGIGGMDFSRLDVSLDFHSCLSFLLGKGITSAFRSVSL
jgi:hypothetical protein